MVKTGALCLAVGIYYRRCVVVLLLCIIVCRQYESTACRYVLLLWLYSCVTDENNNDNNDNRNDNDSTHAQRFGSRVLLDMNNST